MTSKIPDYNDGDTYPYDDIGPIVPDKPPEYFGVPLLNKPPNHYGDGSKMELIDLINAEGDLVTFAKWNAIKYILRHERKNGKEDLEKAQVYLNWLKEKADE